ncbi:hypothetical protein QE152_g39650 [Popillia japonica]|uniref:Uncharacterized protein n=1 Tax=Popillia japonica TaxID=7064 RepID=A0AAW1HTM2_POPJA
MDVIQEPPIKRKRGVVNPSNYQRNRIKSSRSQVKEYVNYKGHVVHAKAIGNSCNCPLKCFQKVNEENRNNVFKKTFYGIPTKNEQDIYLQGQIEVCSVRRRTTNAQEGEKRARSYYQFVKINGKNVKVCLKAFLSIHAVSKQRVQRIKLLLCNNETPEDKRGKNVKSNLVGEQYIEEIREHISCFPIKTC